MKAGDLLTQARHAPVVDLAALTGKAPILILSPHPDDESLGCGGLIAACVEASIPVAIALLTDGAASHPGSAAHPPAILGRLRVGEMREALQALGLHPSNLHELGCPDTDAPRQGPGFHRAIAQIVALIRTSHAGCIVAAWEHDPHCDHAAGAAIAAAAAQITGIRHLAYPVWGWTLPPCAEITAAVPLRLDIRPHLQRKRQAVACHRSQHGLVVSDAAESFTLPSHLLHACLTDYEVFFQQADA